MGLKIGGEIERVNGKELSYSDFVTRYMAKNQPVILTGLMEDWRATTDWVLSDGTPNLPFFSLYFGHSTVQVADCLTREFTDQKRIEMSVSEFIDHWLNFSSRECDKASPREFDGKSLLYLKDWHFVKEYPEYEAYTTPLFFCDDWLNLYLDSYRMHEDADSIQKKNEIACSDYRFIYMGAKGTWTPLHADVFRSYSWSANVCGRKRWYFLSPTQRDLVFDRNMRSSVYDIFEDVSEGKFPCFNEAIWLECVQERNDIIFVPSGWYHQVHNLEDTISINHNWFNGHNLTWVWDLLFKDYKEAKGYIADIKDICDDFEGLCQRNLAANTGINFHDFFIFIARFSFANFVLYLHARKDGNLKQNSSQRQKESSAYFNLVSVRSVMNRMRSTAHEDHHWISTDSKINFKDPEFLKLCNGLVRTYSGIYQCDKLDDLSEDLLNDLMGSNDIDWDFRVSTPDDLIHMIDRFVTKLSGIELKKIAQ